MSERERWIVYPLLFLALGASLRDKLGGRTTSKSIVCQELRIEDAPIGNQPPRPLVLIGRTEASARAPSVGVVIVNGEVAIDGVLKVNGAAPLFQPLLGVSFPDLLRALQAAQARQSAGAPNAHVPGHQPGANPSEPPPKNDAVVPPAKSSQPDGDSEEK